ncbi:UNVERIFIED_CONTAM: hypothetical protein FKN15_037967, partial [Acipenser sinensis]
RSVLKWAQKQQIFDYDIWLVPFNVDSCHWVLVLIIWKLIMLIYLDSMHSYHNKYMDCIANLMEVAYLQQNKNIIDWKDWQIYAPSDIMHQRNSNNCGVHVLHFADMIASGRKYATCTEEMHQIRPWIASELLKNWKETLQTENSGTVAAMSTEETIRRVPKRQLKVHVKSPGGNKDTLTFLSELLSSLFKGMWSIFNLSGNCKKPKDNQSMVFCNGDCQYWYHVECLDVHTVELSDRFYCLSCK